MKKWTALFCAAAMTLTMGMTAMALPSIPGAGVEEVVVSEETAKLIPEEKKLVVETADPEKYNKEAVSEKVIKAVALLNDSKQEEPVTMKAVLEALEIVDITKVPVKDSEEPADLTGYEPITKFTDLKITDGTSVEFDVNGEVISAEVTFTVEALKDVEDLEKILIMQIDPETGEVYFIEVSEEDFDAETGELTVKFPCLGPFTILEKGMEE